MVVVSRHVGEGQSEATDGAGRDWGSAGRVSRDAVVDTLAFDAESAWSIRVGLPDRGWLRAGEKARGEDHDGGD